MRHQCVAALLFNGYERLIAIDWVAERFSDCAYLAFRGLNVQSGHSKHALEPNPVGILMRYIRVDMYIYPGDLARGCQEDVASYAGVIGGSEKVKPGSIGAF